MPQHGMAWHTHTDQECVCVCCCLCVCVVYKSCRTSAKHSPAELRMTRRNEPHTLLPPRALRAREHSKYNQKIARHRARCSSTLMGFFAYARVGMFVWNMRLCHVYFFRSTLLCSAFLVFFSAALERKQHNTNHTHEYRYQIETFYTTWQSGIFP